MADIKWLQYDTRLCLFQLWNYDDGVVEQIGIGHSAHIKRVLISPNENYILSVSADGAILRWKYPNRR